MKNFSRSNKLIASNFFRKYFEMDFHYLSGPVPKQIMLNRSMKMIEYCNGNLGKQI